MAKSIKRVKINYVFFGFIFLLLAITHAFHICLIIDESRIEKSYFIFYAISELFLEITALALMGIVIRQLMSKLWIALFIVFVFFVFLSQLVDFPLVRLMDMSIWFAYNFVADETYDNFIEMLLASNVSLNNWLIGGLFSIFMITIGIFFFRISEKIANRYPLYLSYRALLSPLFALPVVLCTGDLITSSFSSSPVYEQYLMTLPWKTTLLPPAHRALLITAPLKPPEKEERVLAEIAHHITPLVNKPNIYLFIIESLREDFIDRDTAPHFAAFKEENISFDLSLSNSNATQISWFSLFYSKFPFYWTKFQASQWKTGSIPLKMLKQMGYKIHVYSSSRLGYYQMDEMILGQGRYLADSYAFFPHGGEVLPYESDQKTMDALSHDSVSVHKDQGNLNIIFLDSTHFDYSWPKESMTRFVPIEEEINYLKASAYEDVDGIKNRYRNAIYFIDSLFGTFIENLKAAKGYEESIIVMTGDHGEEFYEQGHLFHASNLSHPQMCVPIYYKFGRETLLGGKKISRLTSHMDIFPSILDFVAGEIKLPHLMEGESIFKASSWPFAITARYNASRNPYEFSLHNGKFKLIARFNNEKEIFKSRHLNIISTKTTDDMAVPCTTEMIEENFGKAFKRILLQ